MVFLNKFVFTDAALSWIKSDKKTSWKAADLSQIIRQVFMNNYKSMLLEPPRQFHYSDQETPMDSFSGYLLFAW